MLLSFGSSGSSGFLSVSSSSKLTLEMLGLGRMSRVSGSGLIFSEMSGKLRGFVLMLRRYWFVEVLGINLLRDGFLWEIALLMLSTSSDLVLCSLLSYSSNSWFLDLNKNLLFVFGTNFDPALPKDRGLLTPWLSTLLGILILRLLNISDRKLRQSQYKD